MFVSRVKTWSRLLLEFGLSSGAAQALGMISGLIFVRYMPIADYALYALATTTLAFVTLASDLGLTSALTYLWRKARAAGEPFHFYFGAVRRLRQMLFAVVAIAATIIFPIVGSGAHYGAGQIIVALALVLVTAALSIHLSVNMQVVRLLGKFRQSYYCDMAGQTARVLAAVLMLAGLWRTYWLGLVSGLVCSGVTLLGTILLLRGAFPPGPHVATPGAMRAVLRYVAPAAPGVLSYALQDSLILWLASNHGGAAVVAPVFAVGRIAAIFALISSFALVVVVPRLAGILDLRRFILASWIARGLMALVGLAILLCGWLFPDIFLFLIGPKYAGLHDELLIALGIAAFAIVTNISVLLNRAKGWVRLDPVMAGAQVTGLFLVASFWSFDSAASVLLLSLLFNGLQLLQSLLIALIGIVRPRLVAVAQ